METPEAPDVLLAKRISAVCEGSNLADALRACQRVVVGIVAILPADKRHIAIEALSETVIHLCQVHYPEPEIPETTPPVPPNSKPLLH